MCDQLPSRRTLRDRPVPADRRAGAPGAAAGAALRGRQAAHGQGGGRQGGDQPEHRQQGLPRTRAPGTGRGQAGGGHLHHPVAGPGLARRARPTPAGAARMAGEGPRRRPDRARHRRDVPEHPPRERRRGDMNAVLQAHALGKRYGQRQALADCTLEIPPGHVVGLVGPNGAGKTTLLKIACGMLAPTTGRIEVLGEQPAAGPAQLARVGYVAQDTPTYAGLSVADHLKLGAKLNPRWDAKLAQARIGQLGLDPKQKAGKLSGGQRAQLALTIAVAKQPELLILDEPVASLDPLARRDFLRHLMESVAENDTSVILSSHLVSDLERVCDYLIVLVSSRVQLAGETENLLAQHHRIVCSRRQDTDLPPELDVIWAEHTGRQSTFIVRSQTGLPAGDWSAEHLELEDLVLAYMERAADRGRRATTHTTGDAR